MRVFFDNVNFESSSGPNNFAAKLATELQTLGVQITDKNPDIQLSFIQKVRDTAPTILRLDGIYFNTDQNWELQNKPILESYKSSVAAVFQSEFNEKLVTKYFGQKKSKIINNGTSYDIISQIEKAEVLNYPREKVWLSASSWRPHKRLSENIRYFLEKSPKDHVLLIAGKDAVFEQNPRVFYLGELNWQQLISAMKASSKFIHLAWLDHCPNVVVDARASGCQIICSSSGGTKEIAGNNAVVVNEDTVWDFSPVKLYEPPLMNFSNTAKNTFDKSIDISKVAQSYLDFMKEVLR